MVRKLFVIFIVLFLFVTNIFAISGKDIFLETWNKLHDSNNGYFSPEGIPYYSVEPVIIDTVDQGHESTSDVFSYWIWLEAMYGKLTGDWTYLKKAIDTMEKYMIPSEQPNNGTYNPDSPNVYYPEYKDITSYPVSSVPNVPVGRDPISTGLKQAYGDKIYGMHWLIDGDDFYGFGKGQKPVFINTYTRGLETAWETIPHPCIDDFTKGGVSGKGYIPFFYKNDGVGTYSKLDANSPQWEYRNNPNADARAIQALYWATRAYIEQSEPNVEFNFYDLTFKARKLGDFLRLSFYDKYFKTISASTNEQTNGYGYDSCHYLLSNYYSWGGGLNASWVWRTGSSDIFYGYQNPLTAWVLSGRAPNSIGFVGDTPESAIDWERSLSRQLNFLKYLQTPQGLFSGGITNNWKGRYGVKPNNQQFYGMAYDANSLTVDPSSSVWFGWQVIMVDRLAQYYSLSGDAAAKTLLDKWVSYALSNSAVSGSDFSLPSILSFSGVPGTGYNSSIAIYGKELGVASAFIRALHYYGNKANSSSSIARAGDLLKSLTSYRDDKGFSLPESAPQYSKFTQVVYVPQGIQGQTANGEPLKSGVRFIDLRSKYKLDPMYTTMIFPYTSTGKAPVLRYHRFWEQCDIAITFGTMENYTWVAASLPVGPPVPTPVITPGS